MRLAGRWPSKDDAWKPGFEVKNGRQQISGEGWRNFVSDNKLKPGDICLFDQPDEEHEDADDGRPHYPEEIAVAGRHQSCSC